MSKQNEPTSGPPADLDSRLSEAWDRIESAQDDDEWVDAFLEWLELHRLQLTMEATSQ